MALRQLWRQGDRLSSGSPGRAERCQRRLQAPDPLQDAGVCEAGVSEGVGRFKVHGLLEEADARAEIAHGPSIPEIAAGCAGDCRV